MRKHVFPLTVAICFSFSALALEPSTTPRSDWPQWRGPLSNGESPQGRPPTDWSETKNVKWKVEVPGNGLSTPIVWGDRVFLQTAIPTDRKSENADAPAADKPQEKENAEERPARGEGERRGDGERRGEGARREGRRRGGSEKPTNIYQFVVLAIDRNTGSRLWEQIVREEVPHEGSHEDGSLAPSSPITDGEHLYAYFGSRGLYCLDMNGKKIWEKDFGDMTTRNGFGEGSSPALHGDTLVINWDHEAGSFIVALDKKTGDEKWRVARDETTSWSTPVIVDAGGKAQVAANGANRIRGYDLSDGRLIWECAGMTQGIIPSPLIGDDLLFFTSDGRGSALLAVRYKEASGDITGTKAVAWVYDGTGTPYVASPLLYKDAIYFPDNSKAILSCVDAKTGKAHYVDQRLEEFQGVYASPVAADGRVYVASRDGKTAVIQAGPEFKLLTVNTLDDSFSASPAIAGAQLFLRGQKHLYCLQGG
ncbi:MAG: PQQ-binding-like beta-propeller repeat protein [Phycisphaerales bacterium]|nr:PQQ-binding-like beta-propeller repeat protein [Phycisphaerales bacterium]